jgi:hypothetical protein
MVGRRCTPQNLCPRCSLMKVIQHRFGSFYAKFGREPKSDEPLFFAADAATPCKAERHEMMAQLKEAANETGVQLARILEFLGIEDPTA